MSVRPAQSSSRLSRYGIVVILVSVYLILVANGGQLLLVVGLKQVAQELEWPRSVPSLAYAFLFAGTGIGGIVMGYWYDRSGAGPVTFLGLAMIGTGAILASYVTHAWQLYLIYGVMMGFLGQATIFGPLVVNVMRWYEHRRGFAVGLITAGQGVAGVVWPPLFQYFNESTGWRGTFMGFGIFALLTATPLTLALWRNPPRGPTSMPVDANEGQGRHTGTAALNVPVWMVQSVLCVAIVGCCVAMSIPTAHLVAHASDLGHAGARGAEMLAAALLAATVVRLVAGTFVVDRFGGLLSLLVFSFTQACALGLYAMVDGLAALYAVSVLFGLGYGGINICYAVLVREFLPPAESGRRLGIVTLFGAMGMALGGGLAGYIFDATGAYTIAFLIGLAFNLANVVIVLALVSRRRTPPTPLGPAPQVAMSG